MTLTEQVAKDIIAKLLKWDDYRIEVVTLINAQFLQFALDFFKKIVEAKLKDEDIDPDWYKKEFLNKNLSKEEIAIHSWLNMKTISNMYNSSKKEIVIDASYEHYDFLYENIRELVNIETEVDLTLTIKYWKVSVELNVSETLVVINTLAVKRAALRWGLWSTAGKRVEKPLMQALCLLYSVPSENYKIKLLWSIPSEETFEREIDFYLSSKWIDYKCEVKLMWKWNPESADAVIARDSAVFVADKLSDTNKKQLDSLWVVWVELRAKGGFKKFEEVLHKLDIPHTPYRGDILQDLPKIFIQIF